MARKLTDKQEAYKNNRISGMSRQESYKATYSAKGMNCNSITKETEKLDSHPLIAPDILKNTTEATDKAVVTLEMVLNGLLLEATSNGEGCTQSARVAAWKALSDHTGGFDTNKQKLEHTAPEGVQFNMSFGGKGWYLIRWMQYI